MTTGGTGVLKRSISIARHRTSISLEEPFWEALQRLACEREVSVQRLVGEIDTGRGAQNLSSAIRVYVLRALEAKAEAAPMRQPSESAA